MTAASSTPPPGDAAAAPASPQGSTSRPAAGGQRPPAPPPPPPSREATPAAPASAAAEAAAAAARADRRHARHRLGEGPPARVALASRQPVFVTINDISVGGCCILRKGRLELAKGDAVLVDLWAQDIEMKLSIHARVCWCSQQQASSRAGLRFVETNHRLLRQIETYVQHFQRPMDDSRPRPKLAGPAAAGDSGPLPVPEDQPAVRALPLRAAARRHDSTATPGRPALTSMPRPGRLTSLDLQRRMRPAHRQEVARIAEETGIHIHTLYGWLRTLRLEGEINPERPRDPEAWSATDKFSALLQVGGMNAGDRAAYCSRHGITQEQLERWRQAALQANEKPLLILRAEEELQRLRVRDQRDIRRLQKELRRRERSATISEELLQVVRKLQNLWEQDDPSS